MLVERPAESQPDSKATLQWVGSVVVVVERLKSTTSNHNLFYPPPRPPPAGSCLLRYNIFFCRGLVVSGMVTTAKGAVLNLLDDVDRFG